MRKISFILLYFLAFCIQAQDILKSVEPFNIVDNSTSLDVVLEKGDREEVKVKDLQGIDPADLVVKVVNSSLILKFQKSKVKNIKGKIHVTYRNLDRVNISGTGGVHLLSDTKQDHFDIDLSGAGSFFSKKLIDVSKLKVDISGSGNTDFEKVEAEESNIDMSGTGNLKMSGGKIKNLAIDISGVGNAQLAGVKAETVKVDKSGVGKVEVNCNQSLSVDISGVGDVFYKGDPSVKNIDVSGLGQVRKME